MATEAATPPSTTPPAAAPPRRSKHPYIGILGVFLGASVATVNARLLSIGLPDLRGPLGLGFDEASWLPTVLDMAMMFSGVFCALLNARLGPRRILLPAAALFTISSILLPFSRNLWVMFCLLALAGLGSGTFYTLTLTFALTALPMRLVIFGIAAYAGDIVFTSNMASALQGWYAEHLSWRWIFWNAAVFTPLMMICVYFGVPRRNAPPLPRPSWRGFAYFSGGLALLVGALDQGERLDWLNSGVVVGMLAAGLFLVGAAWIRRMRQPNPVVNLAFLKTRNIIILAGSIFVFRFTLLAEYLVIPAFLGNIQHYRPLQTGQALAWVAVPQFVVVWLIALIVIYANSRLILAVGLTVTAAACWVCAHLDPSWVGSSFELIELVLAPALACSYIGLVSSIVLEALEAGALNRAADVATFSGFMHFSRIFGGAVGAAFMIRFISVREQFHSNLLGLHVQEGSWLTDHRLQALTGGVFPGSTGLKESGGRALEILSQQVRAQAYTMAIADGFILIAWMVVAYLLSMLLLRPGRVSYKDLRNKQ
jgi:MFS transporter, DHA2 family, multidrug resistance protein